jgi:hypothetical protein
MMTPHSQQKTTEQMLEAISAMDLGPIKFKLMDKKEGQGLTRPEVDRLELEYRRFLTLVAKFPDEMIAPDTDVDRFWHGHILDTMKYADDCRQVFGYFLHHFPYFGMRGNDDAANLANAATNTRRLYQQEFGTAPETHPAYCSRVAEPEAAYCSRVAGPEAAYCSAPNARYAQIVLSKGRPTLESVA